MGQGGGRGGHPKNQQDGPGGSRDPKELPGQTQAGAAGKVAELLLQGVGRAKRVGIVE